jgi:hypothetical protein
MAPKGFCVGSVSVQTDPELDKAPAKSPFARALGVTQEPEQYHNHHAGNKDSEYILALVVDCRPLYSPD